MFDGLPSLGEESEAADVVSVECILREGADAADDRIVELITALPELGDVLVYTSDRGIRERVTALGTAVLGSRALLEFAADLRTEEGAQGRITDHRVPSVGAGTQGELGTDGDAA